MRTAEEVPNIRYSSSQETGRGGLDIRAANAVTSQQEFISEDESDNRGGCSTIHAVAAAQRRHRASDRLRRGQKIRMGLRDDAGNQLIRPREEALE